jgi:hypothetical protein
VPLVGTKPDGEFTCNAVVDALYPIVVFSNR